MTITTKKKNESVGVVLLHIPQIYIVNLSLNLY